MQPFLPLNSERLDVLLKSYPQAHIGVIGDFCLDAYWVIDMSASEISLETGKPTQPVRRQRYSLGGAGNVVANLSELGVGSLSVFGLIGPDPFGTRMRELLLQRCVNIENLLCASSDSWQTLTYCKPYIEDDELPRLDMGNFNCCPDELAVDLIARLERSLPQFDLVIINQQVLSGIHTACFQDRLAALIRSHPECRFLYDGRHVKGRYDGAWLKVNDHEALRLVGQGKDAQERVLRREVEQVAEQLAAKLNHPIFITRGDRGCLVGDPRGCTAIPGIQVIGRIDTVGAGDSFLAGLAASLAVGAEPVEAAQVGNFVAAVTITRIGVTGTATGNEVNAVGSRPAYLYEPELAEDVRLARYYGDTEIEIIESVPENLNVRTAIFDHDGTISTLRQGWEQVMEPMMMHAILADHYNDADEALYHRVLLRVRRYIDQTTGIQTLTQMVGLRDLVREFGIVPEEEILDAAGYKSIYNEALMQLVNRRRERLRRGELAVEDFTVKNAVLFLRALAAHGVNLYLASGTDVGDVRAEAEALGYADLFQGRIYGAVGQVTREAKQIVLDRILSEIHSPETELVTFGDGPVEIRETRLRGGLAIGVASDEIRRFELNTGKRSRLIQAGSSILIADFSQMKALLQLLRL
ncbi:MAG TPA: PfkB family carbohydrate kinase [bacterium]|nr:PfkB family carbohydrate kinase [bacterium]HPG46298.1 PfkB family carbohydrate kinase [bacterium]HPM98508.1 PfkB family carbohydrate kinase [bacterium]